ncbi:hypothetical protein [Streptomyces longwoodensis]|uniref:hypothetical protein n=1 Tax=Streptomyces longwoodensis TaxID=68231 RepID=UPI000AE4C815|nr:hypothetical protein [Streptomyces longwoodensis]
MSPRQISTSTPNKVASEPATVAACQQDRRTPAEETRARGDAAVQLGLAKIAAGGGR